MRGWETMAFTPFPRTEEERRNLFYCPFEGQAKDRTLVLVVSKAQTSLGLLPC